MSEHDFASRSVTKARRMPGPDPQSFDHGVYVKHPAALAWDAWSTAGQTYPQARRGCMEVVQVDAEQWLALSLIRAPDVELFQEHRHFLLGLLVAMGTGGHEAVLPGLTRGRRITLQLIRLAQQLPRRRILRIKFDAALEMLCGLSRVSPRSR